MAPQHSKTPNNARNARLSERGGIVSVASSRAAQVARETLDGASRIAVVTKFRFMGDTIVATPFLRQLRHCYPKAEITLLTAPSVVTALAHCPYVDHSYPVEMNRVGRMKHSRELYGWLRDGRFSAAFLLNRSLHCAAISSFAGIPVRIGYMNEFRRPFLTVPVPYFFDRNEVDCHLDMLRALGLPTEDALPELWFTEAEKIEGRTLLTRRSVKNRPLIGIQPGANDPFIREWGAERYARLADALAEETGGTVLLMGAGAERETAGRTADAMRSKPVNLVGELGLRQALTVIGLCDLWIGNDTGLLHAAVAQRVASVGLFGPNKVVRWGYDSPRHRSLVKFPDKPARDDGTVRRCLDAIPEDLVLKTAREVMHAPVELPGPVTLSTPNAERARPPYFTATLDPASLLPVRRR